MFLNLKRKESILSFKVPLPYFVGAICISMIGVQLYNLRFPTNAEAKQSASQIDHCESLSITTRRQTIGLTRPLLLSDNSHESESLNPLKATIQSYINQKKSQGYISDCSVYYKKFNNGEYISLENGTYFKPGSIAKLPILIAILKQSETDRNLLNKKVFIKELADTKSTVAFKIDELVIGKQYSVKELLEYMIENSSNTATVILAKEVNPGTFKSIYKDLNLKEAELSNTEYTINAEGISKFLEVLYNATYLNEANSEYAISMLSQSHFKEGMLSSIPKDVVIAHKYGEQGDENSKSLHETAIIYAENGPYLLTIMTKGSKMEPLPNIIKDITQITYKASYSGSL